MSAFFFDQLPGNIGQFFLTGLVGPEALTDDEKALLINFKTPKRVNEFSSGRFCARQAMGQIGLPNQQVLKRNEREPLWPDGVVGSISHSKKMAGAIVSRKTDFEGLGLDIETIGGVKPEMWRLLFTEAEQQFLTQQTDELKAQYSTLFFSFKESFYKMEYPLLQAEPDFLDVEISLKGAAATIFTDLFKPDELKLYWSIHTDQVITAVIK